MDLSADFSEDQANPTTFRDYLRILFRQKAIIITTIATVLVTVFLALTFKTKVYEAHVKMLISAEKLVQSPNYRDLMDSPNVEESLTQSEIVTSTPVLKRVVQALKLDQRPLDYEDRFSSVVKVKIIDLMANLKKIDLKSKSRQEQQSEIFNDAVEELKKRVDVEPIRDTNMFTINVEDFDPKQAAITANVIARSYVIFDLEQQLADLSLKYGEKQPIVLQLQDNIDKMISKLNGNKLSNIDAIGQATVKIIEQADVPLKPKGHSKALILLMSLVMSVFLGTMFAFSFEYMDPSFKSPRQIEAELGLPFLGSIPRRRLGEKLLIQNTGKRKTRYRHFYRLLCDHLYLLMKDSHLKSILVTAAGPHEGTSTVISNLGLYFSESTNHSVLLLDANFRGPSLHKLFNIRNSSGFADLIEGKASLKEVVKEIGQNLYIITAGETELNPVVLLNSARVKEIIEEVKRKFEVVLIDCPDFIGFKESIALAAQTDATAVVVSEGVTRRHIVKLALQPFWAKKINLLGVILNNRTFPIPTLVYDRV